MHLVCEKIVLGVKQLQKRNELDNPRNNVAQGLDKP